MSKKLRSNVDIEREKTLLDYNIVGICIRHKRDPFLLNTRFLIRNVLSQFPFEYDVPLLSEYVQDVMIIGYRKKIKHLKRTKYYYLRNRPRPQSKLRFRFVVNSYEPEIFESKHWFTTVTSRYQMINKAVKPLNCNQLTIKNKQ